MFVDHPRGVIAAAGGDSVIHVRGVVIEDARGVRLLLGAHLPDPMGQDGARHAGSGAISGMAISNVTVTERGEFATPDRGDEDSSRWTARMAGGAISGESRWGTNLDLFDASQRDSIRS